MATRAKHPFILRENPDYTFSLMVKLSDGREVWYGNYSLSQSAVRWGMSHRNTNKFPHAIQRAMVDEFGAVESHEIHGSMKHGQRSSAPQDPVNRTVLQLIETCGIDPTNKQEVSEFLGIDIDDLEEITDGDKVIWQPRNNP